MADTDADIETLPGQQPQQSLEQPPLDDAAAQAQYARDLAAKRMGEAARRGKPVPSFDKPDPAEPSPNDENPYAAFRSDPDALDAGLAERFRLNRQNAYYRGTLFGASRLAVMNRIVTTPDDQLTDAERAVKPQTAKEYSGIVADLARYDELTPFQTTAQGLSALGGSLLGGSMSPESLIGGQVAHGGFMGSTWLLRTLRAAGQQAGVQAAVDPVIQWMNMRGGVQQEFDPWGPVKAGALGAVIGGGMHGITGELVPNLGVRRMVGDLARQDDAFLGDIARQAQREQAMAAGVSAEPTPAPGAEAAAPAAPAPYAHLPEETQRRIADIEQRVAAGVSSPVEGQQEIERLTAEPGAREAPAPPTLTDEQRRQVDEAATQVKDGRLSEDEGTVRIGDILGQASGIGEPEAAAALRPRIEEVAREVAGGTMTPTEAEGHVADIVAEARPQPPSVQAELAQQAKAFLDANGYPTAGMPDQDLINMARYQGWTLPAAPPPATAEHAMNIAQHALMEAQLHPVTAESAIADLRKNAAIFGKEDPVLGGWYTQAAELLESGWRPEGWTPPAAPVSPTLVDQAKAYLKGNAEVYLSPAEIDALLPEKALDFAQTMGWQAPIEEIGGGKWEKIGGQKGSNVGGVYRDPGGVEWYVKTPKTEDHARNEMLANRLYRLAEAKVPDLKLVKRDGKLSIAGRMLPSGFVPLNKLSKTAALEAEVALREDFAADAWLANWDVIGADRDNVMVAPSHPDEVVRIDPGGALRYRAQGEPKGTAFGKAVGELDTMRDAAKSPQAAAVFKGMTDQDIVDSINRLWYNVLDHNIREAVKRFGPTSVAEQQKLADTLIARRKDLGLVRDQLKEKIDAAKAQQAQAEAQAQAAAAAAVPSVAPTPAAPAASAVAPVSDVVAFAKGQKKPTAGLPAGPPLTKAPKPPDNWNAAGGQDKAGAKFEPGFHVPAGKEGASGVIMQEPDGRVWLVKPKGAYGGYEYTFPKGRIGKAPNGKPLNLQANAIKETFEETGLRAKITGHIGDFTGDTSHTRYYRGERISGSPMYHGDEAEAVVLVPADRLMDYLNKPRDQEIAKAAFGGVLKPGTHGDPANVGAPTGAMGSAAALPAVPTPTATYPEGEIPKAPTATHPKGLPMDQASRMQRAKDLGFNLPGAPGPVSGVWQHSTYKKFSAFDLKYAGTGIGGHHLEKAVYLFPQGTPYKGGTIYPLLTRVKNVEVVKPPGGYKSQGYNSAKFGSIIDKARKAGKDAVLFKSVSDLGVVADQLAVLDPRMIRSVYAAFDPEEVTSAKLAAMKPKKELTDKEFAEAYEAVINEARDLELDARRAQLAAPPSELQAMAPREGAVTGEAQRPVEGVAAPAAEGGEVGAAGAGPPAVPEAAVPPSPETTRAIQSLQQQVLTLARALGMPVRQGRVQIPGALGTFNTNTGVARVRQLPNVGVVAHEAGHYIEREIGQDLTDLISAHANELGPLDYDYPATARPAEGFAEFMRHLIAGEAGAAQAKAPEFYQAFRALLDGHAEIRDAIDAAAQAFQDYTSASSVDVIASGIRSLQEPGGWEKVAAGLRRDGLPVTIRTMLMRAHEKFFDRVDPLAQGVRLLGRDIKQATGALVELRAVDNPEYLYRAAARSDQAALADMKNGTYGYREVDPTGPSLEAAITKALGKPTAFGTWDEAQLRLFSTYLVARRAEYLWRLREAGRLPNDPVAFTRADALQAMADLERANPTFREASDMVHEFQKQQLIKLRDYGIITPDDAQTLLAHEFYVPFMRDLSDKPLAGTTAAPPAAFAQGPGVSDAVRRLRGSMRDIFDPIEAIMTKTRLNARLIAHNEVILALDRLAQRAPHGGRIFEPVPPHEARKYTFDVGEALKQKLIARGMVPEEAAETVALISNAAGEDPLIGSFFRKQVAAPHGEPIVFYRDGGVLKAARIASAEEGYPIYELLTTAPKQIGDMFSAIVSGTSAFARTGIVANPMFAVTNLIKDQVDAWMLVPGYIPFYHALRGVGSEVTGGEWARGYARMGGVSAGMFVAPLKEAAEHDINALAKQGFRVTRFGPTLQLLARPSWRNLRAAFEQWLELSQVTEAGTRNGVFGIVMQQKLDQGLSKYEAMFEAAMQASDLMDFSRYGSYMQMARRYIPFLSAHLQALERDYRYIVQPLWRGMMNDQVFASEAADLARAGPYALRRAMLAGTKVAIIGPILGLAWAALNRHNDAYNNASPAIKATNIVVGFGGNYFLIPKAYELSLGFSAGEAAWEQYANDDPRGAEMFVQALWQAFQPPMEIPFLKTPLELAANYNLFTGAPIVPERLQRLPTSMQFTENTSSIGKMVSGAVAPFADVSPIKVDYAIGGLFGSWGRDIQWLSKSVDPEAPTAKLDDMLFFRRLIKDPYKYSDVARKFWSEAGDRTGAFARASNGIGELLRTGHPDQALAQLSALPLRQRAYAILKNGTESAETNKVLMARAGPIHPLDRARVASQIINSMQRDLQINNLSSWSEREEIRLPPNERRDLMDFMSELKQMEMRNAMVMVKEPGYANQRLLDVDPVFEKIAQISPEVANEIATRYATSRIYKTSAIAEAYPLMERELVHSGTAGDMHMVADIAHRDGFEFEGARVRRPPKRRMVIPGVGASPSGP